MNAFKLMTVRGNFFRKLHMRQFSSLLDIKPEIYDALMNKKAVVALESTIITHGMPYPQNLETAIEVENIVRQQGAVPATISILKGQIKIGLSRSELEELADCKTSVIKTSRRDLAYVLSRNLTGGTTVACTLICADLCGIKLFATGGIGGVHINGENTLDISADLVEMGKRSVTVVSSGIKSILDIPRTMEYLETQGVCVTTFKCPNREFPAFYTRSSGIQAQYNFLDETDAAMCINKSIQLGLNSSILIGVPVPNEFSMDGQVINNAIKKALQEADEKGIKGKDVTPHLLSAISEITKGESLQTNMALIKENAKVAAQIAVELEKIQNNIESEEKSKVVTKIRDTTTSSSSSSSPLVIGGSILDMHYHVDEESLELNGATYKAQTKFTAGGVGRNIAEALYKLNGSVTLISAFGNDQNGEFLRNTLPSYLTEHSKISNKLATASCAIILDKAGDCKLHVGDMNIHREITPELIYEKAHLIENTPLICIDANLSHEAIDAILTLACRYNKPVFYEPTDMLIADKPFHLEPKQYRQIKFMSPNIHELRKIAHALQPSLSSEEFDSNFKIEIDNGNDFDEIAKLCDKLHDVIENIIVTVGSDGIFIQRCRGAEDEFFTKNMQYINDCGNRKKLQLRHYNVTSIEKEVKSSTGAGDSFSAAFITAMLNRKPEAICISVGFEASLRALCSVHAIPKEFFNKNHPCWMTAAKFNIIK